MKLRSALLQSAAAIVGGLLLAKALYATPWGHALLRLVPQRLWSAVFDGLGVQGAESSSTVEIGLVLGVCIVVAAIAVRVAARVLRRLPRG
jgi:hypothetical protein